MIWKKRWIKNTIYCTLFVLLFAQSSLYPIAKSVVVMSVYSKMHERDSFLHEEKIDIQMKGGAATFQKDFFPFVITFDPSASFSRYIGAPVDLTILYNFGAFDMLYGASTLYDKNSSYYSTFYGAYAVRYKDSQDIYGLTQEGEPDIEAITKITDFDLKHLVYNSIGNKTPQLDYRITKQERTMDIDGREFIVFDAQLDMEGMWHQYEEDYMAYIQYGKPPQNAQGESFESLKGYGRIYLHYDQEERISYFFYIITQDEQTLASTEKEFIQTAKITKKH